MCVCYENSQNVNSLVDLLKMHSCQSNQKISSKYVKWLYWIIQVLCIKWWVFSDQQKVGQGYYIMFNQFIMNQFGYKKRDRSRLDIT